MTDWPQGRSEDNRYGRGNAGEQPEGARVMRQVRRGQAAPPPSYAPGVPQQPSYVDGGQSEEPGYNTGQVYGGGGRRGGGFVPNDNDVDPDYGQYRQRPDWRRRTKVTLLTLLVVSLVTTVGTYFWADSKLNRDVDLATVIDRPEAGEGTNYLIVGSDSREGMSAEDKKKLHTGSAEGKRTDSMMILHTGSNGPTLISLPRDSNVSIPEFKGSESGKIRPAMGANKLNAAYSIDGPTLLVRTVEFNTGLHIDHYVEIGFGGFASIVDAVGGVEMDIPQDIKDTKSGADFEKGKQTLNGEQALAFVRTRYALAGSDLDRTKNQQKFLSALANQVATPSTILNPFRLYPTMGAGLDSLIVDKDMGLWDLASMFWAMKGVSGGEGKSMNIPISGSVGGNLQWDMTKVKTLVNQLKNDEKITVSSD